MLADDTARLVPQAGLRGIRNPSEGYLSSYCLTLMVASYLQLRRPPVLPMCNQGLIIVDKCWASENIETVAELLVGFFQLHSNKATKRRVVSLNSAKFVSKKAKHWEWARDRYCVEDPLITDFDTAATVHAKEPQQQIEDEFERGWELLSEYLFRDLSNSDVVDDAERTLGCLMDKYEH